MIAFYTTAGDVTLISPFSQFMLPTTLHTKQQFIPNFSQDENKESQLQIKGSAIHNKDDSLWLLRSRSLEFSIQADYRGFVIIFKAYIDILSICLLSIFGY